MVKNQKQVHTTYKKSTKSWQVISAGAKRAAGVYRTKTQAVVVGRRLAINKLAEHKIHTMKGKISESNSYGGDTFPPRG